MSDKLGDWYGKPEFEVHGIRFFVKLHKPKTSKGRERLWISLRQKGDPKKWRQAEVLGYINGVDIQFEKRD